MATMSLPRSAQFLIESDTPNIAQIRVFRRLASQDVHERKKLSDLQKEGLTGVKSEKKLREGILAYALGHYADAEELLSDDGSALSNAVLGLIYEELEEYEDAVEFYKKGCC